MREARLAARVELEFIERRYRAAGWDVAVGASGTVRGAWRVMMGQGWTDELITREALEQTGGLAVLAGVFDSLGLKKMETSEFALREGVIYDLLGRLHDRDVRAASVSA